VEPKRSDLPPAPALRRDFAAVLDHLRDGVYFVDRKRRITYWNKAAERITGFRKDEVIARCCTDNILAHVDAEGRALCTGACPLSVTMADGRPHEVEIFLHHRRGHRVPVSVRVTPLEDESGRIIGAIELFSATGSEEALLARMGDLEKLALLDPLTRIPNRRQLESELAVHCAMLSRSQIPFGVLFSDIDRFKLVNDTHGHHAGDVALQTVARTLLASTRPFDTVGRWGGEEFVGIYPNVTADSLGQIAARLAMLVRTSVVETADGPLSVTMSIGGTIATAVDSPASLVDRADALMYRSKQSGRDCVTFG
jgi:diguanylate cyclase (GGDEF)-like protein/PAS domain S-box-containing protein